MDCSTTVLAVKQELQDVDRSGTRQLYVKLWSNNFMSIKNNLLYVQYTWVCTVLAAVHLSKFIGQLAIQTAGYINVRMIYYMRSSLKIVYNNGFNFFLGVVHVATHCKNIFYVIVMIFYHDSS